VESALTLRTSNLPIKNFAIYPSVKISHNLISLTGNLSSSSAEIDQTMAAKMAVKFLERPKSQPAAGKKRRRSGQSIAAPLLSREESCWPARESPNSINCKG
jgi:hypothetical protein